MTGTDRSCAGRTPRRTSRHSGRIPRHTGRDSGPRTSRDSGRVSVFLAISLAAILAVIGLSLDGAAHLRAMQRAENLAAEAARTGGQEIDLDLAVQGGPKVVDIDQAIAAAEAYVDSVDLGAGVTATRQATAVVVGDATDRTQLRVTVTLTYQPVMLSLFGYREMTATGTATAQLLTGTP